jgi:zinc protease
MVINALFFELPLEEISTFRERTLAITPDDVQRVARQYIRPDRLSIVLVGNAGRSSISCGARASPISR